MKRIARLLLITFLGTTIQVWAGPAEEVSQLSAPRLEALQRGDVAAYVDAYADNAVFYSSVSPFRVEGKDAIRTQFTELFLIYPKRRVLVRQPTMRVYNDDLVVQNAYSVLYLTDQSGQLKVVPNRSSTTWAKLAGRWQIVDQHVSTLPTAP